VLSTPKKVCNSDFVHFEASNKKYAVLYLDSCTPSLLFPTTTTKTDKDQMKRWLVKWVGGAVVASQ
jgi:hypothetical protein